MVKRYYELLGVEPTASAEGIKKAFRREIAKYDPDKVQHLGREFQEIAAVKAAELTQAYKTVTDEAQRAEYDAEQSPEAAVAAHSRASSSATAERPAETRRETPYRPPSDPAPQPPPRAAGRERAVGGAEERRKPTATPVRVILVPVNTHTWLAHVPSDAPPAVKSIINRLKSA